MLVKLTRYACSSAFAALLALTWAFALAAQSARDRKYFFEITEGSLSAALVQFSEQTGLQVISQLSVIESKNEQVRHFTGEATADEMLRELLKDSGLSHTWEDDYTIAIFTTVVQLPSAENDVNEVLVTGTRLTSVEGGPVPIKVYEHARIDRYGVASIPDLSSYFTQQPFSFSGAYLQSNAKFFEVRGLGFDTTLILINGRRTPPSAISISLNAVDLKSIPLTAVERIEVMTDSASAIYGTDAIGGVVNIILKDRIEEPEVLLYYGQADGGGEERRAAASLGTNNDRLLASLILDYYETGALMGETRDLWRNQDYRRFGGRDYRVTTTNPGNVYSLTAEPLPGLSSSRAAVPYAAKGPLTPADFLATDGVLNVKSPYCDWSITPPSHRGSAFAVAKYSFTERFGLFGEVLASNARLTPLRSVPSVTRQRVPASNPFNPFGVQVAVDYSFAGMDRTAQVYDTDLLRLVGGGQGSVGRWHWEMYAMRHREDAARTMRGELEPSRVVAGLDSEDPQNALDLFSDGPAGSPAQLQALVGRPQRSSFAFASYQASAFVRGPMFSVGELVVGGEWRHDAARFNEPEWDVDVARDIRSVFSEAHMPLSNDLSLKIAVRGDDYGGGERSINPQYGVTWRPARDWLLRAAYGTSFRPPSLFETYMPKLQGAYAIPDPLRGGEISVVTLAVGGNRDLEAVTARSFTAGFVFTLAGPPALSFGASYWRVAMDNRIISPIYQELLKPDGPLGERVVRDPPSDQDARLGWAGRLRSIDLTRMNYGDLETSGIDLDLSLGPVDCLLPETPTCVKLDLSVTWVDEYLNRDMNQALPLNRVDIANVQGTIPRWRTVGTLTWKRRDIGASATTTFTPSYRDADIVTGPLPRSIGPQTLVDLQVWLDLHMDSNTLLDKSTVALGARNLFDEAPEFANAGAFLGYDISQSELTRRFVYLRVSKRF